MVYADVKVWVHSNNSQEIVSANATYLKSVLNLYHQSLVEYSLILIIQS